VGGFGLIKRKRRERERERERERARIVPIFSTIKRLFGILGHKFTSTGVDA
jgi:hypothetical protein